MRPETRAASPVANSTDSRVAIVVVNWNGLEDTVECLESFEQLEGNWQAFVVDNGSTPSDHGALVARFPDLVHICLAENLGFAGGCNAAIARALDEGYSHIFLFNNDAIITDPRTLVRLREDLASHPRCGIIGPKIAYASEPEVIWFAGGSVNPRTGATRHVGMGEPVAQHTGLSPTGYVTGCALLAPAEVFHRIGLLDEDYFLYYEESDWALKARNAGYDVMVDNDITVLHKVSRSMSRANDIQIYYLLRNRLAFARRWAGAWFILSGPLILAKASATIAYNALRGRRATSAHLTRAVIDFFTGRLNKKP